MGRLILIVVVVAALLWLLRRALAGPRKPPAPAGATQGELVSCAHCRLNLPKSEARSENERYYCSEEHLRLGPREG